MKAVRIHSYGHSDSMRVEETPRPAPREGEVVVRIFSAGVNPVDWKIREGMLREVRPAKFPLTLGQDFSGEIVDVGPSVGNFKRGDEVFGFASGSYAEFAVASANEIAKKPPGLDRVTAAALPIAGLTAYQIVFQVIQPKGGESVLIQGAGGGVGSTATQLLKSKGAHVIATASSQDLGYLREVGAELVIDYMKEKFENRIKEVDAVIDLVGGETQSKSYPLVKRGGILVTTLGSLDEVQLEGRGIRGVRFFVQPNTRDLEELARLTVQGIVRPRVSLVLPFDQAKEAQDLNQFGRSHGKVVLKVA